MVRMGVMRVRSRGFALSVLTGLLVASSLSLPTQAMAAAAPAPITFTVAGDANIFGAGHAAPPSPGGGGGGTLPTLINLPAGSDGTAVTFSSVTGTTSAGANAPVGPDGGYDPGLPVDISAYGGISGVKGPGGFGGSQMGVFTTGSEPADPAPATIDYNTASTSLLGYTPLLDQQFFIGDGLTGTGDGQVQSFYVPQGATRLWLGTFDAGNYQGLPGSFDGNTGQLGGSVQFNSGSVPTPIPGNHAPLFTTYPSSNYIQAGTGLSSFTIAASDADGDPLTLSWTTLPSTPPTLISCGPRSYEYLKQRSYGRADLLCTPGRSRFCKQYDHVLTFRRKDILPRQIVH
jgi:hypothetical protein